MPVRHANHSPTGAGGVPFPDRRGDALTAVLSSS